MKKLIYTTLIFATASLSACSWFDVMPENTVASGDMFSEGDGYCNALNGIFVNISASPLYGQEMSWGFMSAISQQYMQENLPDNVSPLYADAAELEYSTTSTLPIVENIWEEAYKAIANVNKLIESCKTASGNIFREGETERDLIHGEALALRAMLHLDLLGLFAPAPSTQPQGTYIPYRDAYGPEPGEKLSVNDFMQKVIRDLKQARDLVYENDMVVRKNCMVLESGSDDRAFANARLRFQNNNIVGDEGLFLRWRGTRMNYFAVTALLVRAYMYAGQYDNAYEPAMELYGYYQTEGWIGFTSESMLKNSTYPGEGNFKLFDDILLGLYNETLATDYADEADRLPLANVKELFDPDNFGVYTDWRYSYCISISQDVNPLYYSKKYDKQGESWVSYLGNDSSPIIPIVRFSEVVQALAEIQCRKGNVTRAAEILGHLRSGRGALRTIGTVSQEQMLEEIVTDIRKECIGEGRLFFQYKRLNLSEVDNSNGKGKLSMSGKYVLPVPSSETIY